MKPGPKSLSKSVRLSQEQWARIERAASIETKRRGVKVYPSALLLEVGMDGVDAILQRATA